MPFYLEVIRGIELGKRYVLADGAITIGRSSENTLQLHENELFVSNHHGILYKFNDTFSIQDMSSKNGIYVNGNRVSQFEIALNDIIGFGEKGPQLKLAFSDQSLDSPVKDPFKNEPRSSDSTSTEQHTSISISNSDSKHSKATTGVANVFLTADMENKLLNNQINADEMAKLMSQGERLEKIMQKGNLSEAQTSLLHSAYGAHRKYRKRAIALVSIILLSSLVLISFFLIRIFQYKNQLSIALDLQKQLNGYEEQIVQAKSSGAGTKEIATIVEELEKTKGQFDSVKSTLKQSDLQQFYTDTVELFLTEILSRFGESDYFIPPQMVERVKYHIDTYSNQLKPVVSRFLKRKKLYFPMIQGVFSEKNIPVELAYISMLESGFNSHALSSAGARGLWQFMPNTGRSYGLKIDDYVDERIEPQKATYAAAEYLKDLIGIFGGKSSIMLVMAAYNAGESRIMRALREIDDPIRNRDFWFIYRMGYLAEETNEYIPRILALMIIDEHWDYFGFTIPNNDTSDLEKENDFIPVKIK